MSNNSFILALETVTDTGSVALLDEDRVIRQIELEAGLRHGTALMPAARECLREANLRAQSLACVAVDIGPGSYTGTRISVMAAKALAFGAKIKLVGIPSLEALAYANQEIGKYLVTVLESRRDEVYVGVYEILGQGIVSQVVQTRTACPEDAARFAKDEQHVLVGKGVWLYADAMRMHKDPCAHMDETIQAPTAAAIGRLAWQRLRVGQSHDLYQLQPLYHGAGYARKPNPAKPDG